MTAKPERLDRAETVQCPNCCRQAAVTERRMGLVFYKCELCESVGAMPERVNADL